MDAILWYYVYCWLSCWAINHFWWMEIVIYWFFLLYIFSELCSLFLIPLDSFMFIDFHGIHFFKSNVYPFFQDIVIELSKSWKMKYKILIYTNYYSVIIIYQFALVWKMWYLINVSGTSLLSSIFNCFVILLAFKFKRSF